MGANAIAAQAAEHVHKALLQATMAGGAAGAAIVPKVNPAAAAALQPTQPSMSTFTPVQSEGVTYLFHKFHTQCALHGPAERG